MTMPASGPLNLGGTSSPVSVAQELGLSLTATISMNQSNVRTLAGVGGSGTAWSMSSLYGKSNRVAISYTYGPATGHVANAYLNVSTIGGYVAGKSDITVYVTAGYYLYATSTGNAGLTLTGATSGDTLTLVNQGYIIGQGGAGGYAATGQGTLGQVGFAGGPALSVGYPITINNTYGAAYIAGGGGGGGGGGNNTSTFSRTNGGGGGGGAGGGAGGDFVGTRAGGVGGGLGAVGGNGSGPASTGGIGGGAGGNGAAGNSSSGGGGGRVLPGSGGTGSRYNPSGSIYYYGGNGGGANAVGENPTASGGSYYSGGGGGGWGAAGGYGRSGTTANVNATAGGAGGRAVQLNGNSVTWVSGDTSRVYGAVS